MAAPGLWCRVTPSDDSSGEAPQLKARKTRDQELSCSVTVRFLPETGRGVPVGEEGDMPFAVVIYSNLEGVALEERLTFLNEQVVPRVKERSGFRTARFLRSLDGATGIASLLFDTEADAQAQLDFVATNPLPGGPTITSTAVFEVILEV